MILGAARTIRHIFRDFDTPIIIGAELNLLLSLGLKLFPSSISLTP